MSKIDKSSKGIAAVYMLEEAKRLRASADSIEAATPPGPLQGEFMRHDAAALERKTVN